MNETTEVDLETAESAEAANHGSSFSGWLLAALLACVVAFGVGFWLAGSPFSPTRQTDPPEHVYVNGRVWTIIQVDAIVGGDLYGFTECETNRITVLSGRYERETLMHELSHAAVCLRDGDADNLWYNSSTSDLHEGIYHFTAVWADLLEHNPDLVKYLGAQ